MFDVRKKYISKRYCYEIGLAFGNYIKTNQIFVGIDNRTQSIHLEKKIILGVTSSNTHAIKIGFATTPVLTFLTKKYDCGGIIITASHNPAQFSGFKFLHKGLQIPPSEFKNLRETFKTNSRGYIYRYKYIPEYIKSIYKNRHEKSLKIAWDCSPGYKILKQLFKSLKKHQNIQIYLPYPNDPSHEDNLTKLSEFVVLNNCDIGFSFDSDMDRIGVINAAGEFINSDHISFIITQHIIHNTKNSKFKNKFIFDHKTSTSVIDLVEKTGNNVTLSNTGRYFMLHKMKETSAIFGSETSHHMYFSEKGDDALYCALFLIKILSRNPDSFKKSPINPYITNELRFAVKDKSSIIKKLYNLLPENIIDSGVKKMYKDKSWWIIRQSNTQEKLVIRCEGSSATSLEKMKKQCSEYLNQCGLQIKL